LYCSSRAEELSGWGWRPDQQEAFLKIQFNNRQQSYRSQFPQAEWNIIQLRDEPIGRLLVSRNPTEILLVDIALLPEHRNRGIGTRMLQRLQAEAGTSKRKVSLHVLKSNPAQHLYARMGFQKVSEDEIYFKMEWQGQSRA
jgi:ribosomal protein S18 acetylase RimI-like enzyme